MAVASSSAAATRAAGRVHAQRGVSDEGSLAISKGTSEGWPVAAAPINVAESVGSAVNGFEYTACKLGMRLPDGRRPLSAGCALRY
jgi:hypothetical protein